MSYKPARHLTKEVLPACSAEAPCDLALRMRVMIAVVGIGSILDVVLRMLGVFA